VLNKQEGTVAFPSLEYPVYDVSGKSKIKIEKGERHRVNDISQTIKP
jgi:hypothetical protein